MSHTSLTALCAGQSLFLHSAAGAAPMIETPDIRVISTEARPGYWLAITYADGREIFADLSDVIRRGGAFEPLQDEHLFSQVETIPLKNGIEWPEPKDEHGEPLISIDAVSIYRAYDHAIAANDRKRTVSHQDRSQTRTTADTRFFRRR